MYKSLVMILQVEGDQYVMYANEIMWAWTQKKLRSQNYNLELKFGLVKWRFNVASFNIIPSL